MRLSINGKFFQHFTNYSISIKHAAIASSFSFTGENLTLPDIEDSPKVVIYDDDNNKLITRKIVNTDGEDKATPSLFNLSGYSLGGVLEKSYPKDLPLQFDNLTLSEIVEKLFK